MSQYGTALLRMCCLYLRDYSLAEDAVQETFLKAYVCQRINGQRIWSLTWYIPASVSGNEFCVAVTPDTLAEEILSCDAVTGGIGKKNIPARCRGEKPLGAFPI